MFYLLYISSAVQIFTPNDLEPLLVQSRKMNAINGISGLLLYKDQKFMQMLEGDREVVIPLYEKIVNDSRHYNVNLLFTGEEKEREFPGWSMGFHYFDGREHEKIPGYSEFLNTPLDDRELAGDVSRCKRFLLMFKRESAND